MKDEGFFMYIFCDVRRLLAQLKLRNSIYLLIIWLCGYLLINLWPNMAQAYSLLPPALTSVGGHTLSFAPGTNYAVGLHPAAIAVGDVHGAGHLDIILANDLDRSVMSLLNRAYGTFPAPRPHIWNS